MKRIFTALSFLLFVFLSSKGFAQVTITSSDSLSCIDTCTTLTAHLIGDAPIDAGIAIDDQYPAAYNPIGFTFNFYGLPYTLCLIGPNGTICFNSGLAGAFETWVATGPLLGQVPVENSICGPWCDIDVAFGGNITYSTTGIAPNRRFIITFCHVAMFSCTTQYINTQMVLYESSDVVDVYVGHKDICPSWYGTIPGLALLGVQNAAGTRATVAPGHDYPSVYTCTDEGWRFTPVDTGTGIYYTVAAVSYAPVPYAASNIYWYNATTGAFIDSGLTIHVCPTTTTTYKAGAKGCADTSYGYYTVTPGGSIGVTVTTSNPTVCGLCDGSLTIHGLTPGSVDTIHYSYNGVPQPVLIATASGSGTITISGRCAGTYSNITATYLTCTSPPIGPYVLTNPPIPITTTSTNPTICGLCNGTITIYGLTAGMIDTVNYLLGGIAQPHVIATVAAGGTLTITGLCAGTYSNIIVNQGVCISIPGGPVVILNPAVTISTTFSNPTRCGLCDGSISITGLHAGFVDTVNYQKGGVAQPPVIATVTGGGSILLTGLCSGTYSNIIVSQLSCTSNTAGPVVLTDPPIAITSETFTNPSYCGVCDGSIVLYGLYPGHSFNVSYNMNGVPQSPVSATSSGSGTITLTGLCGAATPLPGTIYDNIVAYFGTCATPPVGPITLTAPPTVPGAVTNSTNATRCGYCDGTITIRSLPPYSVDSVFYSFNGAVQPAFVTVCHADSSVTMLSLCAGTYSGFTIKIGDCSYSIAGTVTIAQPGLTASFSQATHYGCKGDTVFFQNESVTPGPMYYTWTFGDGSSDTATNPRHVFSAGTYTVTLTTTNLRCIDSFKLPDSLGHPLVAAFSDTPSIICQGQSITFSNNTPLLSTPPLFYAWNFGDGNKGNAINPTNTFNRYGVYNVQLIASNFVPCYDTAWQKVYVDSASPIRINVTDSVLCRSTYITFTGDYTSSGNTGVTWLFGDGDSTLNINPVYHAYEGIGTETVTVTAHFRACQDVSTSRTVNIYEQPGVNLGADTTICLGSSSITLSDDINKNNPAAKWKWNTGQTTPAIVITAPGYYSVKVDIHGCYTFDTIWVQSDCYLNIPNIFTPNGDGVNDYFFPRQQLTRGLTTFKLDIYNRWGQLIFETTALEGSGWDGKLNNIDQPEGVYVYIIDATFKDGQKEHHQGNITLLR